MPVCRVDAKLNSVTGGTPVRTGVRPRGQRLIVSVPPDQLWSNQNMEKDWTSNANGLTLKDKATIKGFSTYIGTLVGSFDAGKTYFRIGTSWGALIDAAPGELTLVYWDTDFENNQGYVDATIVSHQPPP